jgi:hypothetical protein
MAIERFRQSGVSQLAGIPSIDPIGAREAARTGQALSQAMDRVSRFAFASAEQQYRREAKIEGAQMVEDLGAVGALQQITEKGGPQDLVDDVAYQVANRIASNEIETDARVTIQQLLSQAEISNTPYSQVEEEINQVLLGFPAALEPLDPEAAAITKTKLDSTAAIALSKYSEIYQKRQMEDAQGRALMGIDQRLKDITKAATADSEIRDSLLEVEMNNLETYLRDYNFSEEFISKALLGAREQAITDQVITDFTNLDTLEERQGFLNEIEKNPPPELGVEASRTLRRSLRSELSSMVSERNGRISDLSRDIKDRIVDVVSAGGDPGDQTMGRLEIEVEKTGDPALKAEYNEAVALRANVGAFRKMPPEILQEEINQMRGAGITDPFEVKMVESAEKMLATMRNEAEKDPLSLAIKQGIIEPQPLDYSSSEAMSESLVKRIDIGRKAANHYGVTPKYLTDDEANRISNNINMMNSLEKADLAIGMNAMPPEVWEQLADKNQGVFAMVSAIGDIGLGQAIFSGQDLMRDGVVKMPTKDELADVYNESIGDVYTGRDREAVIGAAKALYASIATDRSSYDEDEFVSALMMVTGGVTQVNGVRIQLPRGTDPDTFEMFVDNFSPAMVERFGGVKNMLPKEAAKVIQDLQFESIGNNSYVVMQAGAPLMDESGNPFTVIWDADTERMAREAIGGLSTRARTRRDQ